MCGFVGFVEPGLLRSPEDSRRLAARMADTLTHRGPDDSGAWAHSTLPVALGHRRLSILDTSQGGHQPMASACGNFVLAYNGEIYNFRELRRDLETAGCLFQSTGDTEVLVNAIATWGLRETLPRLNGMFAFAVWDETRRTLTLVRDRLGIKPVYWGTTGDAVLFGSELKALKAHPAFNASIDRGALARMMQHCYVPAPHTIWSGIRKLQPGRLLQISVDLNHAAEPECWWDFRLVAEEAIAERSTLDEAEAEAVLEETLHDSVRARMISDVPLGAFLSGGIDSSLVAALMQSESSTPVKTFTIGFQEADFNEATFAKKVASHLGTEHTELYVSPQQARDVIPRLPELFDEPFADSSQIPTYLVAALARQHVTVALSGDGGDELFGGYHRYFHIRSIWDRVSRIPARRPASHLLRGLAGLSGSSSRWRDRFAYRSLLLGLAEPGQLYQHANLHWPVNSGVTLDAVDAPTTYWNRDAWLGTGDCVEEWMWLDTVSYLPDDILTKVDRASMATSLEARVPLLDHRVVEAAWRLPLPSKVDVSQAEGKLPLRRLLGKLVPSELFERPKMGFGLPVDSWLRGPLRDWAEDLLDENRLRDEGFLVPEPVRRKWREHLSGRVDWHYHLWDVLMFQAWLRVN